MFVFLMQFDAKNARKSSLLIFFCQIDVEISKATLKCSTKQCALYKLYISLQHIILKSHLGRQFWIWTSDCWITILSEMLCAVDKTRTSYYRGPLRKALNKLHVLHWCVKSGQLRMMSCILIIPGFSLYYTTYYIQLLCRFIYLYCMYVMCIN